MLKFIYPNEAEDDAYRIQVHALRYKVFVEELKWEKGIIVKDNNKEFDAFDHAHTGYIVSINQSGNVDATCRITRTNFPYLLDLAATAYPGCVTDKESLPHCSSIIEVSRVCSDQKTAPPNILGQLFAGIHEYALKLGCVSAVSFSDERIIPLIKRFGWDCEAIGKAVDTGTDMSLGLKLPIDHLHYNKICKKANITEEFFPNLPWPLNTKILCA